MNKLKVLPERDQFNQVFELVRAYHEAIPKFLQKKLDSGAALELLSVWRAGIEPASEHAPFNERYELTYNSWLWMLRSSLDFVEEKLDQAGQEEFQALLLEVHKKLENSAGLSMMRLLADPQEIAAQMLSRMQWLGPVEMVESSPRRVLARIPVCKIAERHGMEEVCKTCQRLFIHLAADPYRLRMAFRCQQGGCDILLAPPGQTHELKK